MAALPITTKPFMDLLNFISQKPNFSTIYSQTISLLRGAVKIQVSPPDFFEITTLYNTIHRENYTNSVSAKNKILLVWLVSAFILLTGKKLADLVIFCCCFNGFLSFFFFYEIIQKQRTAPIGWIWPDFYRIRIRCSWNTNSSNIWRRRSTGKIGVTNRMRTWNRLSGSIDL